jgi:predicted ATPase/class 3 adenylate cyclase
METHYPLPPSLNRLRRLVKQLDAFTPYLPAGLLARLASDPRAPSLKGEHRLVANLFANVDGLGDIADELGLGYEAEIVAALNLYFTRMSQALRPFGGVVNKIDLYDHGDKLMVIFGAPVAHEDDAERAVRAARAMQAAFAEVAAQLPTLTHLPELHLQQRIGISYGYVFAGYVGSSWRHEYTVMGDEVNLAARLMSAATPGSVIVSEHVQRRVQAVAELETRGEVQLKGKSRPVPTYAVTGLKAAPEQVRGFQGTQSPLVGRKEEWGQLMADMEALRSGHGRIISIIGQAGVGKSRLVHEWQQASLAEGKVRWISGRCLSYTESVGYAPFQELLLQLLGLTITEDAALAQQQIRLALSQWFPADDAEATLPYIAKFLNIPLDEAANERIRYLDGEALQRRTFVALRTILTAVTQQQPLLILLDAMHWMDRASLDLQEYLMSLVQQLPLAFVWLFRPDREKGVWQLRRKARQEYPDHYREIGLYGLDTAETQQMLLNLVPVQAWPSGVADLILNRVEGNPLYLEEVIRSLMNDGLLVQEGDRWQFSDTITTLTVPDTLEGVLLARLDRLEELCRWTVQVASVVGRSFPYDVVAHTAAAANGLPINQYLTELQLVEIIREAQRNPELVYTFIHTLMQEVSYGTLSGTARREFHRLIARYLEDGRTQGWGRSESLPPLIAHHAYEGEDWPRALQYQMQAGQQAQALFANQEALDHFRKALHAAEQLSSAETAGQRLQIHLLLSQLNIDTGEYDRAAHHLAQAHELATTLQDEATLVAVCRWYTRLYEVRGDYAKAFTWIETGLSLVSQSQTAENAQIRLLAGLIYIRQGNYDAALEQCQIVLQIAEQLGEVTVLARAYSLLGITFLRSDSNQAIANFQKAFGLYQQAGHIQGQATSHNLIANACFNLGRWPEAEYHYLQAHHMFEQIGDKYNLAMADNNLGGIALNRGLFDSALVFYEEGLHLARQIGGSAWMVGVFHMNLGATCVRQGNVVLARSHLKASEGYFAQAQSRDFLPELLRHQARASLIAGELEAARGQIEESLQLARELHTVGEEGISLRVLGQILHRRGETVEAENYLRQSVAMLAELGEEYELARSQHGLARLLVEQGKVEAARPLLTQATETFTRLEAVVDLAAIEELQEQLDAVKRKA